jgi:hypothetical protein
MAALSRRENGITLSQKATIEFFPCSFTPWAQLERFQSSLFLLVGTAAMPSHAARLGEER